ncbi:MAG: hypothetical protein QOF51_2341 [Chloroflexota bacterium]|jgi:uncharacterized alpha-E superfamily protein|nr:hypothetical protein [Chloroflexota bacterium]
MLCRVADDIFWMSRYVERAIAVGRLIDVTWHLELDAGELVDAGRAFWMPLLGLSRDGSELADDAPAVPRDVRHFLSLDLNNPNSLVSCVRSARAAAQHVRDSISSEMWEQINALYLSLIAPQFSQDVDQDPHAFYRRVREGAQFFQGLAESTLAHDEPWNFVCLGTYLERADNVARLLELQAHLLNADASAAGDAAVRWLAVLRSCGSAEAYARYYSLRVEPARVVEFLLLNPVFPQSVRFSLAAARSALTSVASAAGTAPNSSTMLRMGRLCARLETTAVDEVLEEGLRMFLWDVHGRIDDVAEQITRTYLRDEARPSHVVGVDRAALIMAAQQQQQQQQ